MACTNKAYQKLEHHYTSSSEAAEQPSVGFGFIKGFLPFSYPLAPDINVYQVICYTLQHCSFGHHACL